MVMMKKSENLYFKTWFVGLVQLSSVISLKNFFETSVMYIVKSKIKKCGPYFRGNMEFPIYLPSLWNFWKKFLNDRKPSCLILEIFDFGWIME
jgi:hypothetical protein